MSNAIGRPRHTIEYLVDKGKWNEDWQKEILEIGRNGGNKTHMMEHFNLGRETFYKLYNNEPQFTNTVDKAMILSQNHWLSHVEKAFEKGDSKNINSGLWQFMMKNMFPQDFTDSKTIDVTTQGQKINDKDIIVKVIPPKELEQ
jgi:hypothetical protein